MPDIRRDVAFGKGTLDYGRGEDGVGRATSEIDMQLSVLSIDQTAV